jgi:AbrB family looped-hinge helix DNA binding protein
MPESTLTSKGQITIPKVVREALHLEVGDSVYFDLLDDGTVRLVARNAPVESLFGMLKNKSAHRRPISIDEMNPASADEP